MNLYPHQVVGVDWLASRGNAMLLDEQGLGKTITAIVAAQKIRARRVLVLCPTVVLWNWRREFFAWWPGVDVQVLDKVKAEIDVDSPPLRYYGPGDDMSALADWRPGQTQVVVTTHGLLRYEAIRSQLIRDRWDLVIVDEAHNFRMRTAQRTKRLYDGEDSIVSRADRTWLLTGTPMPNDASELWTHLHALFPERIPRLDRPLTFQAFRARYCRTKWTPYGDRVKVIGNRNVADLRAKLDGIVLRRLKSEVLDLPAVRFEHVTVRPAMIPQELRNLEGSFGIAHELLEIAADVNRPDQVNLSVLEDHEHMAVYRRLCGLAKIAPVAEWIGTELDVGAIDKIVIFAHHADTVHGIAHELRRFGALTITGATSATARQAAVDEFQNEQHVRVIVCNVLAGGVGITLTAASEVAFVELSFVPGENAQAADRCHRIGQTAPVRVRFFSLDGFIDSAIASVLRTKTAMIREVLK